MNDDLQTDIKDQIAMTDDPHLRVILLMMQSLYLATVTGFSELSMKIDNKIDAFLADEAALRETVLNGHASNHDAHHQWVAERIAVGGQCRWSAEKIAAEKQEAIDNADSKRRIRDAIIEKIVIGAVSSLSTALGLFIFFGS